MKIDHKQFDLRKSTVAALRQDRQGYWHLWRELAQFILPKRYVCLETTKEARAKTAKNPHILDGTGTKCARILAAGMLNGITSPSRPWLHLRVPGFTDDPESRAALWADEVARRMHVVMAETNFYNALATVYLDLVIFGTAAMLIYEDEQSIFRCYNSALGEYYIAQSNRMLVDTFAREMQMTVKQMVLEFGEENVSEQVRRHWSKGGADLQQSFTVVHLIEPNTDNQSNVPISFLYRETYWEQAVNSDRVLREKGFHELPGILPRWELTGNDSYGTSPGMEALPDIIQLQHETKRKAQGLDKLVSPPIVADIQLAHRPSALVPGGVTFVAGQNNVGVKPAYQIQIPLQELSLDIQDVRTRIGEIFHNPLFNMISQLETVRSATEIDARREEKLVQLGSVLERFENEALDPAVNRIFNIMLRAGLLPDPPEEIQGEGIQVQYVSILSIAQRAMAAAPVERWVGLIGNLGAVVPEVLQVPNWTDLVRNYGEAIGVEARDMKSPTQLDAILNQQNEKLQAQEAAVTGDTLVQGAKTLSETDVGGGVNALQKMIGG